MEIILSLMPYVYPVEQSGIRPESADCYNLFRSEGLGAMKLGHAFTIDICVPSISESLSFYEKLGFKRLPGGDSSSSVVMLTDGLVRFRLIPGKEWEGSLTYYTSDLSEVIAALNGVGIKYSKRADEAGITIKDPSCFQVNVVQAGKEELPPVPMFSVARVGTFGELSLETEDIEASLSFWKKLGFRPTQYMPEPLSVWGSLSDDLLTLGIYTAKHCPHDIKTPSITYFEPDTVERIKCLKQDGIEIYQELPNNIGETKEVVLQAPDGQLIFLFNL